MNGVTEKPTVVIEDSITSKNVSKLIAVANVLTLNPYAGTEKWKYAVKQAIAIVDRKTKLTKEILDSAPNLKLIARTGIGVDETRIDLKEAKKRGIYITYNPGVNSDSVAELTILLALSVYRKLLILNDYVKKAEWSKGQAVLGYELNNKKWGFIGFGNAGVRVGNIARSMGCKTYAFDPNLDANTILSRGAEPTTMENLLSECDIISVHVPLMETTKHLIGEREIDKIKSNAVLINVSRGGIVDDNALYKALKSRKLLGAGLDTLEDEPIHISNPLLELDNIVITPHIGGSTYEGINAGAELAVEEVLRLIKGEPLKSLYKFQ